jgi:hypothetical protein
VVWLSQRTGPLLPRSTPNRIKAANSAGELPTGVAPSECAAARIAGIHAAGRERAVVRPAPA